MSRTDAFWHGGTASSRPRRTTAAHGSQWRTTRRAGTGRILTGGSSPVSQDRGTTGKATAGFRTAQRSTAVKSNARKAASAHIAKIPLALARHIAAAWKPMVAA